MSLGLGILFILLTPHATYEFNVKMRHKQKLNEALIDL